MVSVKVFELVRSKEKSKKAEFEIEEMLKSILVSYH
jgi:phosphoribosylformylglycinamidine (FGAM) synthase PurS component